MLRRPRIIPRLDIKGANVVKGVQMEGLRIVGKPAELAYRYAQDADELLYIDTVATLYGRNQLAGLLDETCERVFVPITVGGGVRSLADIRALLRAGADKVAINTAAIARHALIEEAAGAVGSQAIVISIEAKRTADGWEAYTDNGRERTGRDAVSWAREAVRLGAGEILLTSIDRDGTRKGFDAELLAAVADLPVPVTICGGMGRVEDLESVRLADGVAMASVLHYGALTIADVRRALGQDSESAFLLASNSGA